MRFTISIVLSVLIAAAATVAADATAPKILELKYPKASAVPSGSRFIKAPAHTWIQDMSDLAASPTTMYVSTASGIQRIDPASNAFEQPLIPDSEAADVVYDQGRVWAADYDGDAVRAVDEATGAVVATVSLPAGSNPEGVVAAAGSIWVAEHHGGAIARIDPASGELVSSIVVGPTGSSGPQGLTYGAGSLWVSVPNLGQVVRIDPAPQKIVARVQTTPAMEPCGGIAVGGTAAWVTSCLDGTLVARISLATNKVARVIEMGARSIEPVAQGDTAWFLLGRDPDNAATRKQHAYLVQLSSTDHVLHRYDLGARFTPGGTAIGFGSLWASSFTTPWVARIPLP